MDCAVAAKLCPNRIKIDTGADVTIINEDIFHTLAHRRTLEPSNIPLDSHGGELLYLGYFKATISYKGKEYLSKVYVVRGHRVNNLLSRSLSVKINLVGRIDETTRNTTRNQPPYGHHGTLKTEPIKIQLRDDAVLYAVHTARRVPFPLLQKVKGMENMVSLSM